MSESDVNKTAEAKRSIDKELGELIRKLNAGRIDRRELDAGLKKVRRKVAKMPTHTI
jgi:hypothetical protein